MLDVSQDENYYSQVGKRTPARIEMMVVDDPERAAATNLPAKKEVAWIKLFPDSSTVVERELTAEDKIKYADLYARFQQTCQPTFVDGTPLGDLTWMSRARAEEYYGLKVFSVEQLAEAKEDVIKRAGIGAREDVAKAKAHLKAAKNSKYVTQLAAENEELKAKVEALKTENEELTTAIKEMRAKLS
jgi:hypothetical protein